MSFNPTRIGDFDYLVEIPQAVGDKSSGMSNLCELRFTLARYDVDNEVESEDQLTLYLYSKVRDELIDMLLAHQAAHPRLLP